MFLPQYYNPEEDAKNCLENYGIVSEPGFALDYFGGRNPSVDYMAHSNIIYSNGSFDPWHIGGVLQPVNNEKKSKNVIIWIEQSAHHYDLRGDNPMDTQFVKDARQKESDYINDYIDQWRNIKANEAQERDVLLE